MHLDNIIIFGSIVAVITLLIVKATVTAPARRKLLAWIRIEAFHKLMKCTFCMSFWVSALVCILNVDKFDRSQSSTLWGMLAVWAVSNSLMPLINPNLKEASK